MVFYNVLKHAHSGLRWVVLLLLVAAVVNALIKWRSNAAFGDSDRRTNLFALIASHTQLLLGIVLYFISPRVVFSTESMDNPVARFFLVEHLSLMLVALIIITIGYVRAKRASVDQTKFRLTFWFFAIGLVLILAAIPWPFQNYGTGWY